MKSCILSLSQNRNKLFRIISIFSIVFLLLLGTNSSKSQTGIAISSIILPDTSQNVKTKAPDVVINHAMIKKFLEVNFSAGNLDFRNMMMTYSLDSMKVTFEAYMRSNVGLVSGAEASSEDDSTSQESLIAYPDSRIENYSY